jgi:predicted DCC family thiol-disulfide oxidoreductase YuxK
MTAQHSSPRVTVWFDGACPLCRREIAFIRRIAPAGAIRFEDVAGDGSCPIDRAALLARFHAQEAGGPIVSGAAAFGAMWRATPLLAPLGLLMKWPPALAVMERLYLQWLKVRPRLQRMLSSTG